MCVCVCVCVCVSEGMVKETDQTTDSGAQGRQGLL